MALSVRNRILIGCNRRTGPSFRRNPDQDGLSELRQTAAMAPASRSALPALDHTLAHRIVEDSIRGYFRKRRSRASTAIAHPLH